MSPVDLEQLLQEYVAQTEQLLIGTIHLSKQELHQFGTVQTIRLNQTDGNFSCSFLPLQSSTVQQITHPLDSLLISHEAHFDVIDEQEETIRYKIAYVTFRDDKDSDEITYFFADGMKVAKPLAYVAAFWEQVSEVGRDVDFSLTGCTAHDFAKKIAGSDNLDNK